MNSKIKSVGYRIIINSLFYYNYKCTKKLLDVNKWFI